MIDKPLPPFEGFGPTAIDWFHRLDADNSKPFFLATKPEWEDAIRAPMEQLIAEAAGQFHGTVKLFRPYRDVRFSPDKRPIKTSASGYVTRAGTMGFLYCELSKDGLYAGTGLYDPAKDQLTRLREAIDDGVERRGEHLHAIELGTHERTDDGKRVDRDLPLRRVHVDLGCNHRRLGTAHQRDPMLGRHGELAVAQSKP